MNLINLLCCADIPEDALNDESEDEDKRNPDERISSEWTNISKVRLKIRKLSYIVNQCIPSDTSSRQRIFDILQSLVSTSVSFIEARN